jgi:hypothetical protein
MMHHRILCAIWYEKVQFLARAKSVVAGEELLDYVVSLHARDVHSYD